MTLSSLLCCHLVLALCPIYTARIEDILRKDAIEIVEPDFLDSTEFFFLMPRKDAVLNLKPLNQVLEIHQIQDGDSRLSPISCKKGMAGKPEPPRRVLSYTCFFTNV